MAKHIFDSGGAWEKSTVNVKVNLVDGVRVIDKRRDFHLRNQRFIIDDYDKVDKMDPTGSGDVDAYTLRLGSNRMHIKGSVAEKELGLSQPDNVTADEIPYKDIIAHEFGHEGGLKDTTDGIMKGRNQVAETPERATGSEKRRIFRK